MPSQLQPSLAGITGMARRWCLEGILAEADVRKAMDASTQQKASAGEYLLETGWSRRPAAAATSAEFGMPMFDVGVDGPAADHAAQAWSARS